MNKPSTLQRQVHDWVNSTLGRSSNEPWTRFLKLNEEVRELGEALSQENMAAAKDELADVYLVCLTIAQELGVNLQLIGVNKFTELTDRVYEQQEDGTWKKVTR